MVSFRLPYVAVFTTWPLNGIEYFYHCIPSTGSFLVILNFSNHKNRGDKCNIEKCPRWRNLRQKIFSQWRTSPGNPKGL